MLTKLDDCYFCRDDTTKMTGHFDGYVEVPSKDESAVMEALMKHGPLAVGVDASFDEFLFHRWAHVGLRGRIGCGWHVHVAVTDRYRDAQQLAPVYPLCKLCSPNEDANAQPCSCISTHARQALSQSHTVTWTECGCPAVPQ